MPRKKEGLGPAFSCRLREEQDRELRREAKKKKKPLVVILRRKLDKLGELEATSVTVEVQAVVDNATIDAIRGIDNLEPATNG